MNAVVERVPSYAKVEMEQAGGGGLLMPKSLGEVVSFAKIMARADIALPKFLRNNEGACMAVTMQALRWEMDPFAVANKAYSVNDRLAYEAQLIAAVVHTRAPIKGRPNYTYSGEGPSRQCKVVCTMSDGETREYESPRFDKILVKNSPLWKSDPDQQLGYFAIRSWARRHTPEVILGVYTPEEVEQFRDVTPGRQTTGMRARIEARDTDTEDQQGFSADHVAAETAGGPGEATAADAEFTEHTDAPPSDREVTPGGEPSSGAGPQAEASHAGTGAETPADPEGTSEGTGGGRSGPPPQASEPDETDEAAGSSDREGPEDLPPTQPPPASQDLPLEPKDAAPQQSLAQRTAAFRAEIDAAQTTIKMKQLWQRSAALRTEIDAADPEGLAELEFLFNDRYGEIEEAERRRQAAQMSKAQRR